MSVPTAVLGETLPAHTTLVFPDLEVDRVVVESVVGLGVGSPEHPAADSTSDTAI